RASTEDDCVAWERFFKRAIFFGGETYTAQEATFFRAGSLFRMQRFGEALDGYEQMIRWFPDSTYVAESHYNVGLCLRQLGRRSEAAQRFQYVVDTWPGNQWAKASADQLQQMRSEPAGIGG